MKGDAMADEIPNLWPPIPAVVRSPLVILRAQQGLLSELTGGVLEAEVVRDPDVDEQWSAYGLDVIAPALDRYVHRILTSKFRKERVYPVLILAECYNSDGSRSEDSRNYGGLWGSVTAVTESDFVQLLGATLRSTETVSVLQSLIARSSDAQFLKQAIKEEAERKSLEERARSAKALEGITHKRPGSERTE
jgi:hypothetical protein